MLPIDHSTHQRVTAALDEARRARASEAWQAVTAMEMPSERDESWRYVHPGIDLTEFGLVEEPAEGMSVLEGAAAVSIDGHTVTTRSVAGAEVLAWRSAGDPAGSAAPGFADRFEALHGAFCSDGVVVDVPRGSRVADPVVIDLQAATPGAAMFPRITVRAATGAQARVRVEQRSPSGVPCLVVPRFEVTTEPGAMVELTVIQQWGDATNAVARHHYTVGRDATVGLAEAGIGGRYSRLHLTVDLVGDGGAARVIGAYFGDADQTLDYRYFLRHAARGTTSEMFLKGAVAGESRSVFTGMIRIEPEGQKTSAHQTNRNLVLSDGAEAHSVPNLEILADDVRCGHGSAVGPLDEDQRYYLMSRGLDRARADRLQVKGFFEEALLRFPDRSVEPALRAAMMDKYAGVAR